MLYEQYDWFYGLPNGHRHVATWCCFFSFSFADNITFSRPGIFILHTALWPFSLFAIFKVLCCLNVSGYILPLQFVVMRVEETLGCVSFSLHALFLLLLVRYILSSIFLFCPASRVSKSIEKMLSEKTKKMKSSGRRRKGETLFFGGVFR